MNVQDVKNMFSYRLKEMNFMPSANKRLFIQDRGFYLIVVEIVPWHNQGFMLNVGVKFMWSSYYDISYDYSDGDIRVYGDTDFSADTGVILFDNPKLECDINQMKYKIQQKVLLYQELDSFELFTHKIKNRNDFIKNANPGFEKRDVSLAIIKIFSGDFSGAEEILCAASAKNSVAAQLNEHCDSIEHFQNELIKIINQCRYELSGKLKITLDPVSEIWGF